MIGMVVVVPNVYWEQPGSVISQSTHSGGRLLFCSTVLLLRTIQLCGPVLPQQLNCSMEWYTHILAVTEKSLKCVHSTYSCLHKGNSIVDTLIKARYVCVYPVQSYSIIKPLIDSLHLE